MSTAYVRALSFISLSLLFAGCMNISIRGALNPTDNTTGNNGGNGGGADLPLLAMSSSSSTLVSGNCKTFTITSEDNSGTVLVPSCAYDFPLGRLY